MSKLFTTTLRNTLLEGKTQNSGVLMLELGTSEKGYQAPTEGGWVGGWEGGTPNATSCGLSTGQASSHNFTPTYFIITLCISVATATARVEISF